jgi:hypothetical protein
VSYRSVQGLGDDICRKKDVAALIQHMTAEIGHDAVERSGDRLDRVPPDHHHAAATSRLIVVVTDPDTVLPTVSETVRAHSLNVW